MRELTFRTLGLGDDAVGYLDAWDLQRRVHAAVVDGGPEEVLLLEHPPVFTAGKRTEPHERPIDPGGAAVIDVDRGGKITFHGPGQLVGYPIVRLPEHVKVVDYVRRVEEALIAVCADFGTVLVEFNGEDDHVHLLVEYPPTVQLSRLVNSLKGVSSRRLRQRFRLRTHRDHLWSPSYFAASCGGAPLAIIRQYVEQQRRPG